MVTLVVPHKAAWKGSFRQEASAIKVAFGISPIELCHIGSTAIPGIVAKPIIDLMGQVPDLAIADARADALEHLGYEVMGANGIEGRRYYRKINAEGIRTHHLHIFERGSRHIERHLAFRDYLIAHPKVADEYSSLKKRLTASDNSSWGGYLDGKDPFISRVELQAIDWFRRRTR